MDKWYFVDDTYRAYLKQSKFLTPKEGYTTMTYIEVELEVPVLCYETYVKNEIVKMMEETGTIPEELPEVGCQCAPPKVLVGKAAYNTILDEYRKKLEKSVSNAVVIREFLYYGRLFVVYPQENGGIVVQVKNI